LVIERVFLLKLTDRIGKIPRVIFTLFLVIIGWVFFRVESITNGYHYVKSMFGMSAGTVSLLPEFEWKLTFVIAAIFSFFVIVRRGQQLQDKIYGIPTLSGRGHIVMTVCSMLLFALSLSYITGSGFNPFIYFRF